MDVDYGDIDCEELASCNNVGEEEGKKEINIYKKINDLTDDDIRGLEFASEEKAIDFYEIYAKCHGFAVRKDDVKRDYEGNIIVRQLVCNREGKSDKKRGRCRDPRPTTRMECRARFRVALNLVTEKWRVSVFESSHNHELTPAHYVHLIPKYRRFAVYLMMKLKFRNDCGVWVIKWMEHIREDVDKIDVDDGTRLRIALDLTMNSYNKLNDLILERAWEKINKSNNA